MLKRHVFTILFCGWVLCITMLSLFSFEGVDTGGIEIPYADKMTHFIFYAVFVMLGHGFVRERFGARQYLGKTILLLIGIATAYGMVIEALQYVLPYGRAAELGDVLANFFGALFGGLLTRKYLSRAGRSKSLN